MLTRARTPTEEPGLREAEPPAQNHTEHEQQSCDLNPGQPVAKGYGPSCHLLWKMLSTSWVSHEGPPHACHIFLAASRC